MITFHLINKKTLQEGAWIWIWSGQKMDFEAWGVAEPNGGKLENCLKMFFDYQFPWNDENCLNRFRPICQKV